jgi:predicted HicB family RNase H-like nuclease
MFIRADEKIKVALKIRAAKEKTSVKSLVSRVMQEYIEKMEQVAEKANT